MDDSAIIIQKQVKLKQLNKKLNLITVNNLYNTTDFDNLSRLICNRDLIKNIFKYKYTLRFNDIN